MRTALRLVLFLALAGALQADPAPLVPPDGPLAAALSDARVVVALHRMAAREGLQITRIARRPTAGGVVLTFHARPRDGAAQARLEVELKSRDVVRVALLAVR